MGISDPRGSAFGLDLMTIIYPGLGLGGTYRPRLAGTMGYAPVGSVLPPVGEIISAEPIGDIISDLPDSVTSDEIADVISSLEDLLIIAAEPTGVISSEIFGAIAERLELEINQFAQLASQWGTISGIQQLAQTITTSLPFYRMTAVEILMRREGNPTDDVTLDIHEWHSVGIPPLPEPPDGPLVSSITVAAADIPATWGIVRFVLPTPLYVSHTEYAFVLKRSVYSDTDYYGTYINQFANYAGGEAWGKVADSWGTGGASDLPLKVFGIDTRSDVTSEEPNDLTSDEPSDIISDEPIDGIESEEPT